MSQGDHAADDGSFARSAGVHAGRAAILIAAALAIGFLVLDRDTGPSSVATSPSNDPRDIEVPEATSTTIPPTTTTVIVRPPDQVKVIALNATNTPGVAAKVTDQLRVARYNILAAGNATATAKAAERTSVVFYTAGYNREALIVAQVLAIPPTNVKALSNPPPSTDARAREANVVVLVKEDLVNRPTTTTIATTTTRRP